MTDRRHQPRDKKNGVMVECEGCGQKAIEKVHRPQMMFIRGRRLSAVDDDGWLHKPCYVCYAADWKAADEIATLFGGGD